MTEHFGSAQLSTAPEETAPDGSRVRPLLRLERGSMSHFTLAARQTSTPIVHKTVDEIWYITGGTGQMWRKNSATAEIIELHEGVSLSIPVGTSFQFRSLSDVPLQAIGQTMPPWPGADEHAVVEGAWPPSVGDGTAQQVTS